MDDDCVRIGCENCKPIDGRMAWASHVDPQRGPIGRVDGPPLNVRRFILRVTPRRTGRDQIIRHASRLRTWLIGMPTCASAMRRAGRKAATDAPPGHGHALRARLGKLDWDKVREIRASGESRQALAERRSPLVDRDGAAPRSVGVTKQSSNPRYG